MKTTIWTAIFLTALTFSSCEKEAILETNQEFKEGGSEHESIKGSYNGTFSRTGGGAANPVTSNVTLNFLDNKFSGTSSLKNYPAICEGTFTVTGNELSVVNSCIFTADFDWSFIFNGTYQYKQEGSKLQIWRDYTNGTRDIYTLHKN